MDNGCDLAAIIAVVDRTQGVGGGGHAAIGITCNVPFGKRNSFERRASRRELDRLSPQPQFLQARSPQLDKHARLFTTHFER